MIIKLSLFITLLIFPIVSYAYDEKQLIRFKVIKICKNCNLTDSNLYKEDLNDSIVSNTVCLIIGPEGGFSDDEIQEARDNKVTEISLGENRLRSETAAIYGLSHIKSIIS